MTFAQKSQLIHRQTIQIFEIDLDVCANVYGNTPCNATFIGVNPTGTEECFNMWSGCQDRDNYVKTINTIRFSTDRVQPPTNLECLPFLNSVSTIPTRLDIGRSIGTQATRNLTLQNPPYHDRIFNIDPYATTRAVPSEQATFFGKLIGRKKYFEGRTVRVLTGFLEDDGTYDPSNFRTTQYTIKKMSMGSNGMVTIQVASILRQADGNKIKFPLPSSKKLLAESPFNDTQIQVDGKPEHFLDYLGNVSMVGEFVRIGEEIMQVSSIQGDATFNYDTEAGGPFQIGETLTFGSGATATLNALTDNGVVGTMTVQMLSGLAPSDDDTISGGSSGATALVDGNSSGASDTENPDVAITYNVIRGAGNTLPADASIGDTVQHVYTAFGKTVKDAFYDVVRAARIDAAYIPYNTQWEDEQVAWLQGYEVTTWRSEPTEIKKVLNNLIKQTPAFVFYDERNQEIRLLAMKQSITDIATEIDDEKHIIQGSDNWKTNDEDRISRVSVLYNKFNQGKPDDEKNNYLTWEVDIDSDAEDDNAYGSSNVNEMTILGTWITNDVIAQLLSQRMLQTYDEAPLVVSFSLDVKDSELFIGDYVRITTRKVIDEKGNPRTFFAQIIEVKETKAAHLYEYMAQELVNGARAKVWSANVDGNEVNSQTYVSASDEEKETYIYWSDNNGENSGVEGSKWV